MFHVVDGEMPTIDAFWEAELRPAREYADRCGVPWGIVVQAESLKEGWLRKRVGWMIVVACPAGTLLAAFSGGQVFRFEFYPCEHIGFMLPPWLSFPQYSRTTSGWRQGYGEGYLSRFREWRVTLTPERLEAWVEAYPAPDDWRDFL